MHILLQIFLSTALAAKDPFRLAVYICLVFDRNTAEMAEDVLHLGVGVAASVSSQVVNRLHADQDVVDHSNDDDDTNRITPDDHHCDNRCLRAVSFTAEPILGPSVEVFFVSREPA